MPKRQPNIFIPSLYIAEGLPYTIVNMMSVIFFKSLGASNEFIGLTSFLYIPWAIKFFWSPFIDLYSTRRQWIIGTQLLLALLIALFALTSLTPFAIALALVMLTMIALLSATQDIAIDGYYLDALNKVQQAFYVGIRNAAYKFAWLLGAGAFVFFAGVIGEHTTQQFGWSAVYCLCALMFLALAAFHSHYLPQTAKQDVHPPPEKLTWKVFSEVFSTYFRQKAILPIVIYILIFRAGDALMLKMAQPFLLEKINHGGLGISIAAVGIIYGTIGTLALIVGGIVGGWLVAKGWLIKWLLPTALIQNLAILLYWLLALFKPAIGWVAAVNALEQFAYGLGVSAYTVFLLSTVKEQYKAAHYAIATGLMATGVMLPGAVSGYLCATFGYANFFLLSFFAAIPGLITIYFLPISKDEI